MSIYLKKKNSKVFQKRCQLKELSKKINKIKNEEYNTYKKMEQLYDYPPNKQCPLSNNHNNIVKKIIDTLNQLHKST